jgi:hypothetical protein
MAWTYTTLSAAIQAYTESDEPTFVANIPNFVTNAETVINNYVQLPAYRKNVTGETTQNFQYLNLPSDFLSSFSLAVIDASGNYSYLLNKDVNYIREAFPFPGSPTGLPQYYALFSDQSMIMGPTPDACYVMELHYFAYPPSITIAQTSWVGTNFPNVLLYGSLVEAYTYLKGENDLLQTYQSKFQEGLDSLKNLADSKDREDAYRTTQVRYPTK